MDDFNRLVVNWHVRQREYIRRKGFDHRLETLEKRLRSLGLELRNELVRIGAVSFDATSSQRRKTVEAKVTRSLVQTAVDLHRYPLFGVSLNARKEVQSFTVAEMSDQLIDELHELIHDVE
jgi:hypothetical protein